jgi:hypothetical protein
VPHFEAFDDLPGVIMGRVWRSQIRAVEVDGYDSVLEVHQELRLTGHVDVDRHSHPLAEEGRLHQRLTAERSVSEDVKKVERHRVCRQEREALQS